jgi:hypothetical protein
MVTHKRTMPNFWASFWVPKKDLCFFEAHNPWWISGYDDEDRQSVCFAISADCIDDVATFIDESFDKPVATRIRFIDAMREDESPFSDRFSHGDWMKWPITTTQALELRSK